MGVDINELCGSFTLTHFNGKKAPTNATLTVSLEDSEAFVHIHVVNTLQGKVQLDGNRLTGFLMSTMMGGDEAQMSTEYAISDGFRNGFEVRLGENTLLLKNDSHSLIFSNVLNLADIYGNHCIISLNGEALSEECLLNFVSDGHGGCFVIANVTNSIRGHCDFKGGILRGDVASSYYEADSHSASMEEKIISGLRVGFHVEKNETGLLLVSQDTSLHLLKLISHEDITGEFLLKSFNGDFVTSRLQPTVQFQPIEGSDDLNVFITVANRIRGSVSLNQNVFKADDPFLSTRMMGTDDEYKLEAAYNTSFQYGLQAVLVGQELTLKDEENTFVLVKIPTVNYANGEPSYKGTYVSPCFKDNGNSLLYRIVNSCEGRWAFYNDAPDYRMRVRAMLGSRSKVEALGNTSITENDDGTFVAELTIDPLATEMFVAGSVNGYKLSYEAHPIDIQDTEHDG